MREVTDTLDGLGFDCYWSGQRRLWAITSCWDERYANFKQPGTVVCARRYNDFDIISFLGPFLTHFAVMIYQ